MFIKGTHMLIHFTSMSKIIDKSILLFISNCFTIIKSFYSHRISIIKDRHYRHKYKLVSTTMFNIALANCFFFNSDDFDLSIVYRGGLESGLSAIADCVFALAQKPDFDAIFVLGFSTNFIKFFLSHILYIICSLLGL